MNALFNLNKNYQRGEAMLIKNALVSTSHGTVSQDVLIEEGKIVAVGQGLDSGAHEVVDAQGFYLLPGLIDLNVRFSNSCLNQEHIDKLSSSCLKGGVTHSCCYV